MSPTFTMNPLRTMNEIRFSGLKTMKEYAQVRNVEYQPFKFLKVPKLLRTYRGCPVEYYLRSQSSGDQNMPETFTTHIRAAFPHTTGFSMSITRRARLGRLLDRHGRHSAETGDTAFDEMFGVRSSDLDLARQFLSDPEYRALLLETASGLAIEDKKEGGLLNRRSQDVHYVKFFVYSFITTVEGIDRAFETVDRTLDRLAVLGQARLAG